MAAPQPSQGRHSADRRASPASGIEPQPGDPRAGKEKLEVLETEYQDFRMDVAPSKGNLPRSIDPATVPYSFADVYQRDEFYPGEIASCPIPTSLVMYAASLCAPFPLPITR